MTARDIYGFLTLSSRLQIHENATEIAFNLKEDFMQRRKVADRLRIINITYLITHWEKLLYSDWLRDCKFIRNLRANSVIRGKLQISRAKSVIHSEYKYKKELTINN